MQPTIDAMRTSEGYSHRNAYRRRIESFQVERLRFREHHGLMVNNNVDYRYALPMQLYDTQLGGSHWLKGEASIPISQTRNTNLILEAEFSFSPADADTEALTAVVLAQPSNTPAAAYQCFVFRLETEWLLGWEQGRATLYLEASAPLPDDVTSAYDYLDWSIEIAGRTFNAGQTGPHQVFVTHGVPRADYVQPSPVGPWPGAREMGISHYRMTAATTIMHDLLNRFSALTDGVTNKPVERLNVHHMARCLMSAIQGYTLKPNPLVPRKYGHAGYYNQEGGAWAVHEWRQHLAECQAIARFARGVLYQLGAPGTFSVVAVYALDTVEGGKKALEDSEDPPDPDPEKYILYNSEMHLQVGLHGKGSYRGRGERLCLASEKLSVGDRIPRFAILNVYESCLKVTAHGTTRYYGGGMLDSSVEPGQARAARAFTSIDDVLTAAFVCLVWVQFTVGQEDGVVTEVVCRYVDGT